jgi:hypothetical protein
MSLAAKGNPFATKSRAFATNGRAGLVEKGTVTAVDTDRQHRGERKVTRNLVFERIRPRNRWSKTRD